MHILDLHNRPRKLRVVSVRDDENMEPTITVDKLETLKNGERQSVEYVITHGEKWHIRITEAEARAIIEKLVERGLAS